MEKRSIREIVLDMKRATVKLTAATIKIKKAEKERTAALVELLHLERELEGTLN